MRRSVLVVDDDPTVLAVLTDMLEDLGCQVISAANGPDALDQLRRNQHIAILITDINMPGMDGHELARYQTGVEGTSTVRPRAETRRLPDDQEALH